MKALPLLLCTAFAALVLGACGEEKIDVPVAADAATSAGGPATAATSTPVQQPDHAPVMPLETSADAVRIGTALDSNQAATATKATYSLDDTIHASILASAHPGKLAKVYWTYQDGSSHKEEEKPAAGENVAFQFSRADGMKAGDYNVEIDVDGVPAGITDFKVR
jgi:hypothetical protein